MSKTIVWDFDGVISDSINECFINSYWSYHGWNEIDSNLFQVERSAEEKLFRRYRYLVGPAYEYCFLWDTIHESKRFADIPFLELYQKRHLEGHTDESRRFYDEFFRLRSQVQEHFTEEWVALNPVYSDLISYLPRLFIEQADHYIASTKDEVSILKILNSNGISFPKEKIFGKIFSVDKQVQLKKIMEVTGETAENLLFIDDNLDHLVKVKALGVRCYMADWGYNTFEMQQQAKQKNIIPVSIEGWKKVIANE
jgi:phosphoglycolate phosphatase-like HAD superfamily hydrolase